MEVVVIKVNILKPFPKDISFKRLFLYFIIFMAIGITIMFSLNFIFGLIFGVGAPDPAKSDAVFCALPNFLWLIIAFAIETLFFMILPWKIWGMKGLKIGLGLWAILHLLGGTTIIGAIPYFLYISIKAVFYYKCLEINRWREIFLFHALVNLPAILTCLI